MRPLRRLLTQLEGQQHDLHAPPPQPGAVSTEDVKAALGAVRPTVSTLAERYQEWEREFGSV